MIKCEMERHFARLGRRRARDRRAAARAHAGRARRLPRLPRAADVLLRRQLLRRPLGVGAGPLPRGALRRGPAARARADRGRATRRSSTRSARVLHSHDYPPAQFFRRYFDEFRSLREVLGHVAAVGPADDARGRPRARRAPTSAGCERAGRGRARRSSRRSPSRRATTRSGMAGAIVGTRADRLPARAAAAALARGPRHVHAARRAREPAARRTARRADAVSTPDVAVGVRPARATRSRPVARRAATGRVARRR